MSTEYQSQRTVITIQCWTYWDKTRVCQSQLILVNLPCNNARLVLVFELAEETSPIFGILFCQMQHGPKIKKWMSKLISWIKKYWRIRSSPISRNAKILSEAVILDDCVTFERMAKYDKPSQRTIQMIENTTEMPVCPRMARMVKIWKDENGLEKAAIPAPLTRQ